MNKSNYKYYLDVTPLLVGDLSSKKVPRGESIIRLIIRVSKNINNYLLNEEPKSPNIPFLLCKGVVLAAASIGLQLPTPFFIEKFSST